MRRLSGLVTSFVKSPAATPTGSRAAFPSPQGLSGLTMAVFKFTVLMMLPNPAGLRRVESGLRLT